MTDYKPWFHNISSPLIKNLNSEKLVDYKYENKKLLIEINKLSIEINKLSIEVKELKSFLIDINIKMKVFSSDCSTAIKELLEILNKNPNFKYTNHRQGKIENAYYSIINNSGIKILFLEDHSNNFKGYINYDSALITTPQPSGIVKEYKHIYDSVAGDWEHRKTSRSSRKKYDIRGKKVMDVMDILNQFC